MSAAAQSQAADPQARPFVRLFLCGDVMTGRGIDQVLPHPCDPQLHEGYVRSAIEYVKLAEDAHGAIPRPVAPSYIWGIALDELERTKPDVRIINLETSITRSADFVPKGINYRMSPENAECLTAAKIDCCVLANNHVLDWGRAGLLDTLSTLQRLHIKSAGAGHNAEDAGAPAVLELLGRSRVLVFAMALPNSGVPRSWAATSQQPGINVLPDLSETSLARTCHQIDRWRKAGDIVVVSIHWGPNWGYEVDADQTNFARALIERADAAVVHGHSSHHAKAIEVYRNRLILYGCGDFLNDYEGIRGYEEFRDDLPLMYLADLDPASRDLAALEIVPLQIRQFRLTRPSARDIGWVQRTLDRECQRFSARVIAVGADRLALSWSADRDR
jgi:poly-gamma-glutamate capsule biosynthesis protein CapA/YwtB (metallophosphatase superfamily)